MGNMLDLGRFDLIDDEIGMHPVFTDGEVQQLRAILKQHISDLEYYASEARAVAKQYKKVGVSQEVIDSEWKEYYKARAKIKKLANLQVKMKAFNRLY